MAKLTKTEYFSEMTVPGFEKRWNSNATQGLGNIEEFPLLNVLQAMWSRGKKDMALMCRPCVLRWTLIDFIDRQTWILAFCFKNVRVLWYDKNSDFFLFSSRWVKKKIIIQPHHRTMWLRPFTSSKGFDQPDSAQSVRSLCQYEIFWWSLFIHRLICVGCN